MPPHGMNRHDDILSPAPPRRPPQRLYKPATARKTRRAPPPPPPPAPAIPLRYNCSGPPPPPPQASPPAPNRRLDAEIRHRNEKKVSIPANISSGACSTTTSTHSTPDYTADLVTKYDALIGHLIAPQTA
ncbi:hypothetical protein DFP73DRAFT_599029 [Morchella snyderi]|nr:hypothetical protein DFP73DRAFT_599029 [Morchella snyderi]